MVHRFRSRQRCRRTLPHRCQTSRRRGELLRPDPSKAFEELGWKAVKTLDDMVRDSWMCQLKGAKN